MNTTKDQFWNKAMEWGLYIGLAVIVISVAYYISDSYLAKSRGWIEYFLYAAGIVMCTLAYKKTLGTNQSFTYGRAVGLGVATSMFASIILALYTFIFLTYFGAEIIEEMLIAAEEALIQAGLGYDLVEQQMSISRMMMKPLPISLMSIFGTVFAGLIISLLTSIFLRNKPNNGFESAMSEINNEE